MGSFGINVSFIIGFSDRSLSGECLGKRVNSGLLPGDVPVMVI
jgi:hypothetical protein